MLSLLFLRRCLDIVVLCSFLLLLLSCLECLQERLTCTDMEIIWSNEKYSITYQQELLLTHTIYESLCTILTHSTNHDGGIAVIVHCLSNLQQSLGVNGWFAVHNLILIIVIQMKGKDKLSSRIFLVKLSEFEAIMMNDDEWLWAETNDFLTKKWHKLNVPQGIFAPLFGFKVQSQILVIEYSLGQVIYSSFFWFLDLLLQVGNLLRSSALLGFFLLNFCRCINKKCVWDRRRLLYP